MSVSAMVDAGHCVIFNKDQNCVDVSHAYEKATGEYLNFTRRRGVYELDFKCEADQPLEALEIGAAASTGPRPLFRGPAASQL